MSVDLDTWLDFEAERWRLLVEHPNGMPTRFDELCRQTAPFVVGVYRPTWNRFSWPDSVPAPLYDAWLDQAIFWERFMDRNPRVALVDILMRIAGTDGWSTWPDTIWCDRIREWVRSGFTTERPFKDRLLFDSQSMRQELWDVSQKAGAGWPFWEPLGVDLPRESGERFRCYAACLSN